MPSYTGFSRSLNTGWPASTARVSRGSHQAASTLSSTKTARLAVRTKQKAFRTFAIPRTAGPPGTFDIIRSRESREEAQAGGVEEVRALPEVAVAGPLDGLEPGARNALGQGAREARRHQDVALG